MSAKGGFGTIAATIAGAVFAIFGTFMYVMWPSMFDHILNSKLVLSPGSSSYHMWEVTPIPLYIEFYLFNWTNPEDIEDPDESVAKPKLVELGPYVFREHREKVIKEWVNENNTITFMQNRTWFFEPGMSKGNLSDRITTINVPAITATFALRKAGYAFKVMLELAMRAMRTKIHVTKTARQFLFDGYSDPLLNLASIVPASVVPVQIPFDKFGWFYARNGSASYDGVFNMFTGVGDITKFGDISAWNYMNHTKYYEAECGMVNGSTGEFFPPNQHRQNVSLFVSDICRPLTLTYQRPSEVEGIDSFRYWGDGSMFDNITTRPDNWCFCPSGTCPPNGAFDISSCKFGAPAFVSFPHFRYADPSYLEAVDGMKPNETIHQLYLDLEPKSGIPLQVQAALQINILMEPRSEYFFQKSVPKIYFPCVWFRQLARIDDSVKPLIKLISLMPSAGSIVSLLILSTGLSIIAILGICLVTRMCKKGDEGVVLTSSPSPTESAALSRRSSRSSRPRPAPRKLKSMKSLVHAYIWTQRVSPREGLRPSTAVSTNSSSNGHCSEIGDGKIQNHHGDGGVIILPAAFQNEFVYDSPKATAPPQPELTSEISTAVGVDHVDKLPPISAEYWSEKGGTAEYM